MYISNEKIRFLRFHRLIFQRAVIAFCNALMDELKLMNHWGVVKKLSLTDAEFDSWLASLGLAYTEKHFENCSSEMSLTSEKTESGQIGKKFRCNAKACRKKIGYRSGAFFEDAKLGAKDIFHLS